MAVITAAGGADSLHELFQNKTKSDKCLISVTVGMAFPSPWQ